MDMNALAKNLHPLEVKLLRTYKPGETITVPRLEAELGYKTGQANQALSWLLAKNLLAETGREPKTGFALTDSGRALLENGTPDERLIDHLKSKGPKTIDELCAELGLDNKDIGSAIGQLSRDGVLAMDGDNRVTVKDESKTARVMAVKAILAKAAEAGGILDETALNHAEKETVSNMSKKRGAQDSPFRQTERDIVSFALEPAAMDVAAALEELGITGEELGPVTRTMLERGDWKSGTFRAYNISVAPARVIVGRHNAYCKFLEGVKDKLCSLGFEEFDGGLVETEFWNSDALFMPQFHSARDIHDVYRLKTPVKAREIEEPYLSRVASTHENGGETGSRGWEYSFDAEFTSRLVLRSQGTVLSARQLPTAKIPGKYFGIARCFRYDKVDATHLSDFYQTEGIVLGEEANLRTLLGFLKTFAVEVAGATEVKYVPGYFPFTEPSVEVHARHPVLGWFELGGAGIFRQEVTEPLGVKAPVLAWGMGIDRMALMALGLNDLRDLFSPDIESVRLRRSGI